MRLRTNSYRIAAVGCFFRGGRSTAFPTAFCYGARRVEYSQTTITLMRKYHRSGTFVALTRVVKSPYQGLNNSTQVKNTVLLPPKVARGVEYFLRRTLYELQQERWNIPLPPRNVAQKACAERTHRPRPRLAKHSIITPINNAELGRRGRALGMMKVL
jgi:hypothetical protein